MAILGPGSAPGRARAGLRRPGHAVALAARLGGLHGGCRALAAHGRGLLDPGCALDENRHGRFCPRSTGILRNSSRRSTAKPGSSCRTRPRRAKASLSTFCSEATPISTPAAVYSGGSSGHYHPFTNEPVDDVPLIELMTALELAAEDLSGMCRQIPGGDMISLSHWRRGRPSRRLHQPGERPVLVRAAVPQPGDGPHPAGHAGMDREAGVEVDAAERAALVLRGLCQPAGNAPDRAHERPAGDRRPSLSPAHQSAR